jgi:hypothetical protein
MHIVDRFRRLTPWNKISVIGALASVIALAWLFVPTRARSLTKVGRGAIIGDVNTGGGNVTITGDIHVESLADISSDALKGLLAQERLQRLNKNGQRKLAADERANPSLEPQGPRRWLPKTDTPASIIKSLSGALTFSEYRSRAESLYEDHWISDPGWSGVVYDIPE